MEKPSVEGSGFYSSSQPPPLLLLFHANFSNMQNFTPELPPSYFHYSKDVAMLPPPATGASRTLGSIRGSLEGNGGCLMTFHKSSNMQMALPHMLWEFDT